MTVTATTPATTPATTTPSTTAAATGGMDAASFDLLRTMVREDSAIVLEPGKEYLVESRLAPILRREGFADIAALVQHLRDDPRSELRAHVLDAMTTNETSFFRDVHPWQTLREVLLPELIAARQSTRRLDVWCAACSSGQEPYTLAMLLASDFPEIVRGWQVRILATDISSSMVARCRDGSFSQLEVNRGLPAPMLARFFHRDGAVWRIDESIRQMVDTHLANLAAPSTLTLVGRVDLVLMRNVLIYFDQETKQRIVGDAVARMRRDGVLMLGSSEVAIGADQGVTRQQSGKTVYFRPT